MSLFAIGDLHLSFSSDKPMDKFYGWENYVSRLTENWKNTVSEDDTVILDGDFSWAMSLEEAKEDFLFVDSLPGHKILVKGNHDYWWTGIKKTYDFWNSIGVKSFDILQNNSYLVENKAICGTRGWFFEDSGDYSEKLDNREAQRLKLSLEDSKKYGDCEKIVFLHFPPLFGDKICANLLDVMYSYGVKRCYYGHLHGASASYGFNGNYIGIDFQLISADYLNFMPKNVDS